MFLKIFVLIRAKGGASSEMKAHGTCREYYYAWIDKNPDVKQRMSRIEDQQFGVTESGYEGSRFYSAYLDQLSSALENHFLLLLE